MAYTNRRLAVLARWCDAVQDQLGAVGLADGKSVSTNKLLNRLLGLRVELQGQIFGYFSTILDKVRGGWCVCIRREGRGEAGREEGTQGRREVCRSCMPLSCVTLSLPHCVTLTCVAVSPSPPQTSPQVVAVAKKEGRYDATGIIKPGCESIELR